MQTRLHDRSLRSTVLVVVGLLTAGGVAEAKPVRHAIASPSGKVSLSIDVAGTEQESRVTYAIAYKGRSILLPSSTSLLMQGGAVVGESLSGVEVEEGPLVRKEWKPLYGERSTVVDSYRALVVRGNDNTLGGKVVLTFRCYDAGVAFQIQVDSGEADKPLVVESEQTEFRFGEDATVFQTTNAQGLYDRVQLSEMGSDVERPCVLRFKSDTYVAIAEAALVDYARMNLRRSEVEEHTIVSDLASEVKATGSLATPWRVVMVAGTPGELVENNDLLLNLSEPCKIADTSWIKPGKVLRDITLTTEGGLAAIDFAVAHNFGFVEFDAGWYGHEYDESSDATTITIDPSRTDGPFDLHAMIAYGKERGIGVIVYVNRRALERQLDEILPLYKSWGLAGVKYGFVQVGSQKWTRWLHDAIRKAAEHELMVDVHDEYRPTGFSRTYPNFMTQEGVRGDEAAQSTEQALTTLFTRCIAGATDFTVCYHDDRVDELWSHAQQLAKPVCFYSPWQFLFWYDQPKDVDGKAKRVILGTPEIEFFSRVPTVWDETRFLHGAIGEYAVVARRSGEDWFVGAINADDPRTLETPLDFLEEGKAYTATIYQDDPAVDTPTKVRISERQVNSSTVLSIELMGNGGQAMHLQPAAE